MEQIKYKVPFASIGGTLYNINIYAEYSGEPIVIWGSQQPFVTEEDQNEDRLTPIRTQSGYINIVTSRDVWLDIIENASLVTLTSGDEEKWVGFISKQAFNGDAFEQTKAYQIPVHDILTQWQSYKFEASPFNSPTFAKILTEAMDRLPVNAKPLTMCWQDRIANDHREPTFFECRFQRYNMYNGEMPEDGQTAMSDYTYFDVISEICKYFGMTLSVQGRELVFMSSQDSSVIYRSTTQDLYDVEGDGVIALRDIETIALPLVNLNDLKYVSIDNQESVLPPVKEVKIVGKINVYEDFDGTYPEKTVNKWIDQHEISVSWQNIGSKDYRRYERAYTRNIQPGEPSGSYFQEWDHYENETVIMKLYSYESSGESLPHSSMVRSIDDTPSDEVADKIDYNWNNLLWVLAGSYTGRPVLGLYGKRQVYLSANSGALNLFYSLHDALANPHNHRLVWRLSVGDHYWNGSAWTNAPATFPLGWRGNANVTECQTNRRLGDKYNGLKGMIIPINIKLQGFVILELMRTETGGVSEEYFFNTLKLTYIRPDDKKRDDDLITEIRVSESTGVDSIGNYAQNCMFATSRDVNGYGTVLAYSGVALSAYNYGGTWQIPEVFRNGLVRWNNNRPLSVLDIEVSSDGPLQNRYQHIGEAEWSAYIILSMSRDWRDDKLKLKLLEFI